MAVIIASLVMHLSLLAFNMYVAWKYKVQGWMFYLWTLLIGAGTALIALDLLQLMIVLGVLR